MLAIWSSSLLTSVIMCGMGKCEDGLTFVGQQHQIGTNNSIKQLTFISFIECTFLHLINRLHPKPSVREPV